MSCPLYGSHNNNSPFSITVAPEFPAQHAHTQKADSDSSEEEELSHVVINGFLPGELRASSSQVFPYVKQYIEEALRDRDVELLESLRARKNPSSSDDDIRQQSSPNNAELRVQALLLKATHKVTEEQQAFIAQQMEKMKIQQENLENRVSKSYSAGITAVASVISAAITALSVYFSKECES